MLRKLFRQLQSKHQRNSKAVLIWTVYTEKFVLLILL